MLKKTLSKKRRKDALKKDPDVTPGSSCSSFHVAFRNRSGLAAPRHQFSNCYFFALAVTTFEYWLYTIRPLTFLNARTL